LKTQNYNNKKFSCR